MYTFKIIPNATHYKSELGMRISTSPIL